MTADKFIKKLEAISEELVTMNKSLFVLHMKNDSNDDILDQLVEEEQSYQDKLFECIHNLKLQITSFNTANQPSGLQESGRINHTDNSQLNRKLQLPKISLPTFGNLKDESFRKFIISFESIVDKHNLTSYEKFYYLKSQLSKGPRTLIDSLDVSRQLYEVAKELLIKAFDNEIETKFEIIKRMSNLKLGFNDDPYTFIGDMRTVIAEFESLKINVQEVIQFFVWNGLNQKFQDHLISITNKSKPGLTEISDCIFEATNRYSKSKISNEKNFKSPNLESKPNYSNSSYAIDVKPGKFCCLCKFDGFEKNHDLRDCKKFPTAQLKVNKLKAINGCLRCGFGNHITKNCRYKFFSNCRNCNREHATHLCLSGAQPLVGRGSARNLTNANTVEVVASVDDETIANQSIVEVQHSAGSGAGGVSLPTFTADLIGKCSSVHARIFKDGGAQRNFITRSLVKKLELQVLERNVTMNIRGFVSEQCVSTDIVEVPIVIGQNRYNIPAVCVDRISTEFRINNLKYIMDSFASRGYIFADKLLDASKNRVSNINMILGSESNHILPSSDTLFGDLSSPSVIIETPIGIMLTGCSDLMYKNCMLLGTKNKFVTGSNNEYSLETGSFSVVQTPVELGGEVGVAGDTSTTSTIETTPLPIPEPKYDFELAGEYNVSLYSEDDEKVTILFYQIPLETRMDA